MIEDVIRKIEAADMILVGIGEELDSLCHIEKEEQYRKTAAKINSEESAWMLPFLKKSILQRIEKKRTGIYEGLQTILKQKNYFVVSLCQDGLLRQSGLDQERITEPCGGYDRFQCTKKCSAELYPVEERMIEQIRGFWESGQLIDRPKELFCPKCGSGLEFNNIDAADYLEEGYLESWSRYKKWLQGTVNKKLCVIELGVGMKYPTVIRWPFEKIVYFNQRAEMFRIHDRLYQIPEEIRDRAHGICRIPEEFLMELDVK